MQGKLEKLSRNMDGTWSLTVTVGADAKQVWDKYHEHDVDIEVKRYVRKRSLDANAFCWALCSDIGKALRPPLSKEDVYKKAIRDVGEYMPFPVKAEAVERFKELWNSKGVGWFAEDMGDSKLPKYKLVFVYFGSSSYDAKQMGTLIDYLVDDAEQMGIQIPLGKKDIERLKNDWRMKCESTKGGDHA